MMKELSFFLKLRNYWSGLAWLLLLIVPCQLFTLADYVKGYYVSPVAGVDYTKIYTVGRP